ncbi:acyl transferase domain-containing protein/thioesterase domain-containing protein [Streptomyces phaeochromogenes]|uniref:beta-ketoacyl synthase N-terminal-like domain-containing protein n=1 Tax=Streptomyces phaeochromogenes TaxID=1923 RepID=UPI00278F2D5D|nr:beta-ketoacyl synthase N-terminal-like domain-containing protein [Streptomyces phaeochromogenes]MDQ0947708.1 acyl transferase domain-containing protein/thioesterase domain-containing protein [Streptomyces phaeochromogenes]
MSVSRKEIRALVAGRLQDWYGVSSGQLPDDRPLAEAGLTSRDAVALTADLSELAGRRLPDTLLWEAPTIDSLVRRLGATAPPKGRGELRDQPRRAGTDQTAPIPVAVIGVGARFPGGVTSPATYWELLTEGRDAVGTLPPGRWDPFVRDPARLPDDVTRHGAFLGGLDDIAGFDAEFFGIPAHEATAMDPQHRMLLEVTREALDHAALCAPALAGTRTGVFVGISGNEYAHLTTADLHAVDAWTATGASMSIAAGRLSYALDLRGPSLSVDTACSSSLVAVHHAVRSLVTGESDTALAAGVNLLLTPAVTLGFQRAGALAPDGRCKAFDASADGIVRGEGCGVVVLKRLADAERDGDRVLAVIHATAVNSDGRSNGLTAPNTEAQCALLTEAHTAPTTVDYVEAHGTGTALGDPIEASALGAVLGRDRPLDQPLLIGSAKTNLGHLEAAAGIAGLIKTVLALHHGEIPAHLHFTRPGPHADLDALGLRVVGSPEPWPRYSGTATAGVSAFGFGGTNAHVVLAEHRPAARAKGPAGRPALLLLDGQTKERVRAYAGELAAWLDTPDNRRVRDADLARTLAGRTGRGRHRAALVTRDRSETLTALGRLAAGDPFPRLVTGEGRPGGPGPMVWVFSGYGSQWPGMGSRLLATEPVFAAAVDRLEAIVRYHAGLSLRAGLRPDADLSTPATVMPVLYGVQVALAELWRSYGLEPDAVIGHSLGEIAAAVVSGALDEATGARIVAVRSRLLDRMTGGAMAVVELPAAEIPLLTREFGTLEVAVHSSPTQSVVTGSAEDVAGLVARVTENGGFARSLGVSGAGHSPEVEPLLPEFAWELGEVRHSAPRCRRYSTALGDPRESVPCDTEYWAANLRNPVRFAEAVRAAAEDGHRVFVEVAPHATQLHPLTDTLRDAGADDALIVPTLRRDTDDALTFRTSLATLLVHGIRVAQPREGLHPEGRIVDVPPPRWRHRRFWAGEEPAGEPPRAAPLDPAAGPLERLRLCVAAVMGYSPERLDPDTPLTDLGLDSLTAVRIRAAVQREFDVEVEPGVLLRRGTLRGVAELLEIRGEAETAGDPGRQATPRDPKERGAPVSSAGGMLVRRVAATRPDAPTSLRAFPGTGPGTPLFLAHAAGGSADVYARLAERLDGDRPVYGFDRQPDPDDVPGRAEEFARRIREAQPKGPWMVGGWSYGGLVAQETVRLLAPHGRVPALVLLDSVLPLPTPLAATDLALRHFRDFAAYVERTYGTALDLPYDELAGLDDAGRIDLVVKVLQDTVDLPDAVLEHQRTSYLDLRSGERHRPGRHAGRTLLYRASETAPHTVHDPRYERGDATLGWDAHCTDLTVVPLPGHHLSLLDPPVVDTLAALLTRDLRDS